jgi:Bax protein
MKFSFLLVLVGMMGFPFIANELQVTVYESTYTDSNDAASNIATDAALDQTLLETTSKAKPDFALIKDVNKKKAAFFGYLRPYIDAENTRIMQERTFLYELSEAIDNQTVSSNHTKYASALSATYQLPIADSSIDQLWIAEMLERVNVIPESLILTQAANESAWGTSRFAVEANNFFGQWCYSKGCGLVPEKRPDGATHEVAKFADAQQSVRAYFMNINRNQAYKELRTIRSNLDSDGDALLTPAAAIELTQGLLRYSERGQAYVDELQSMIRFNSNFWIK